MKPTRATFAVVASEATMPPLPGAPPPPVPAQAQSNAATPSADRRVTYDDEPTIVGLLRRGAPECGGPNAPPVSRVARTPTASTHSSPARSASDALTFACAFEALIATAASAFAARLGGLH